MVEDEELEGERPEHPLVVVVGGCKVVVGRSVGNSAGKSEGLIGFGGSGWMHVIDATSFSPKRILI